MPTRQHYFIRIFPMWAMIPGLFVAPAHGATTITKDDGGFAIASPVYHAHIDAKSGLLDKLEINGATAIEKMAIDLDGRAFTNVSVVQEGPAKIAAYISAPQEKESPRIVEKALNISYETDNDSTLLIKVTASVGKIAAGRGPRFTLGSSAQMVRSLEFGDTIPMPVLQGRSPWQKVKFYFANGATLGILNSGAGNPLNPNENGGVGGWDYSRGGFVPNSEYVYTLIAERNEKPVLGAPSMQIVEASTPAVFWQGEPIRATLKIKAKDYQKFAGMSGLRVKYEVQDAFEQQAARGEMPLDLSAAADPIEIKVPLAITKLGWYRAYFTVNDAKESLLEGKERLIFSVLKHQPNMGEKFDNQIQTDYTIGLGLTRLSTNWSNPEEVEKYAAQCVANAEGTDVNLDYAIDGSPVGNDPKKFGALLFKTFDRVKDKVPQIEIINEPNGTLQPKEYIDTFLRPAYENIKKASPKTKVLGPVLCGISGDQARYLSELYKLGMRDLTDELTFHPYAGNFDDGDAVASMQKLMEVISTNGDSNKPVHFTEAGYGHQGWSNLASLREVIKLSVSQYAWQNAVMGINHQHNFYYFTDTMGYYDWWLRSTQLTPAAVALRTYTGFVKGQGRARLLSFGSLEVVRAFQYPGAQRQVVLVWTAANYVPQGAVDPTTPVSFKTDAKDVDVFDCFGNPLPSTMHDGELSLNVGSYPTYLVLPPKARIDPVQQNWGNNVALLQLGALAEATTEEGVHPAASAIDGNTSSASSWRSLVPNELPQSLTVTLAGPTLIDRVGIWGYSPRGYDLEALGADGKWIKLAGKRDQPYQRFRSETFPAITTDQVRLTIIDSFTDRAEVAELQIFSPANGAGKGTELVNWALKSQGSTAKASSEMRKQVKVAELDWGAKKPRISNILLEGKAENAIDGKRRVASWKDFFPTTWMADVTQPLPQWLEVDFAGPKQISSVTVYTVAFETWTPDTSGIRDWDVQVWTGNDWKTVDSVTENVRVSKTSRLRTPVTTDRIRILVKGTNDPKGTVAIMEVEAYGPK